MCQEKKNKKDKDKKSKGPKIFNPEDGGVPKLKIKTVPPKVRNIFVERGYSTRDIGSSSFFLGGEGCKIRVFSKFI